MAVTRFHRLLQDKVAKVLETESAALISGLSVDYAAYREAVGYIRGLTDALKLCDEIEEDLTK